MALSRLPSGVEGLRAAILAEDRVAMNEAVADLSIQIGVNFGEPDRAARHASILPRIDVLVADEVEAHPTYVVQLP